MFVMWNEHIAINCIFISPCRQRLRSCFLGAIVLPGPFGAQSAGFAARDPLIALFEFLFTNTLTIVYISKVIEERQFL